MDGDEDEGLLYQSNIGDRIGLNKVVGHEDGQIDNYVEIAIGLLAIMVIMMIGFSVWKCVIVNNKNRKGLLFTTESDPLLVKLNVRPKH